MIPPFFMRVADHLRTIVFSFVGIRTLGAMALLVDEEGKVLLVRQTYGSQMWTLPGGGVRRSESFSEAAVREASEEAGVSLRPDATVELLGMYFKKIGRWADYIGLYVITGWESSSTPNSEIAAVERFPSDQLPEGIAPAVRRRIEEWRGDRPPSSTW